MGVAKTITHLREIAAERFYKQPTELPPDYTALERHFTSRANALESAVRMSKQSFGFRSGASAAQSSFGDSLVNYGAEFDDEDPLSYGLCKVGELQERLAANQDTFETITRANYIAYWTRLLESDVAVARRAIEKVHKRRLEFDSHNTGRDRQGFFEIRPDASAKYMEAGRNLQSAIDIAKTHMERVVYNENATQLQNLLDLVSAQSEYYRACLEEVDRVKQQLQGKPTWRSTGEIKPLNRATRRVRYFTAPPQQMPLEAQTQIYRQPIDQRNGQLVAPLTTLLVVPPGGGPGVTGPQPSMGGQQAWQQQQDGQPQLVPLDQVYKEQMQQSQQQAWQSQQQQPYQQQQEEMPNIGGSGTDQSNIDNQGNFGQQQQQKQQEDISFVPDRTGRDTEAEWQPESTKLAFGQSTSGRNVGDENFVPDTTGIVPMTSQSGVDPSLRGISSFDTGAASRGTDFNDTDLGDSIYGQGYGQRYAGAGREKTFGQSALGEGKTESSWQQQQQQQQQQPEKKEGQDLDIGQQKAYTPGTPAAGGDLQTLGAQDIGATGSTAGVSGGTGIGALSATGIGALGAGSALGSSGGTTENVQSFSGGGTDIGGQSMEGSKAQQLGGGDVAGSQQAGSSGMSTVKSSDVNYGRALYDFSSRDESNLQFKRGDIVRVIKHYPQGWAYGDIAGRTGFFPASYVKELV